jgi:hypothetical protein
MLTNTAVSISNLARNKVVNSCNNKRSRPYGLLLFLLLLLLLLLLLIYFAEIHSGYQVSFPEVKRPERGVDYPPFPSSAEVKERIELHL